MWPAPLRRFLELHPGRVIISRKTKPRHIPAVASIAAIGLFAFGLLAAVGGLRPCSAAVVINEINYHPSTDLEEEEFDRVWNANTRATYLMARAVAAGMRESGWGRIVNLSASSAFVRNRSVYTLANAAIITLTEELAVELAPEIGVNAIAPGQINESLEELRDIVPDWAVQVISDTPRGRLVTRREIADIVVLLCGPLFDSVTGVTLPVDGGLRLNTF